MRILILDDDRSYGALLASASKKLGHRAIVKVDAQEAVQMLRNQEADIALVDLDMPTGTGTAFAKTLRKNGITVPVAFCTGTCRDSQLIQEAESMGQVLPKIWTHADLRVILSALQLESNSINRLRAAEADNSEITEPDQRRGSVSGAPNEHYRGDSHGRALSGDSSQDIARADGSRPGPMGKARRPPSRDMSRPPSREISVVRSREDLRTPHDLRRPPSGEVVAPQAPVVAAKPAGKNAGKLSPEERKRAQAPTAAPIPGQEPQVAPEFDPLDMVDAIPPPLNDPPPLELDNSPNAYDRAESPVLEMGDSYDLGSGFGSKTGEVYLGNPDQVLDLKTPPPGAAPPPPHDPPEASPRVDPEVKKKAGSTLTGPAMGPLIPPNPFAGSTTSPEPSGAQARPAPAPAPDPEPPKKRLDTMLEVGEALRETPRVNIGCSNWDQVRRLCGDVMRGMSTITVRARSEMRAGEDVVVALELPDEMVVSIPARVLDFRERSSDGKRPYQLDLVGFGSDEITYLLGSCDANSSDSQETIQPVPSAPAAGPAAALAGAQTSIPKRARTGGPGPDPVSTKPSDLPPSIAAESPEPDTNDRAMPSIPDAIDAVDSEVSYEEKGPTISWS